MDTTAIQNLRKYFDEILTFSQREEDDLLVTKGTSKNDRTILEIFQRNDVLIKGSLLLALPDDDELEMFKLVTWSIIYLSCVFPQWTGHKQWMTQTVMQEIVAKRRDVIQQDLPGYRLFCRHHKEPSVLDFYFETK